MNEIDPSAGTTITVTGLGRSSLQPDRAEVGLGANASAETAAEARTAVAAAMTAILAAVRGQGVRTLQTSNLSVAPRYDHRNETARIVGYEATNAVTMTMERPRHAGRRRRRGHRRRRDVARRPTLLRCRPERGVRERPTPGRRGCDGQGDDAGRGGRPKARLPEPPRKLNPKDVAVITRPFQFHGAAARLPRRRGASSPSPPDGQAARAVFDAVEQARVEASARAA